MHFSSNPSVSQPRRQRFLRQLLDTMLRRDAKQVDPSRSRLLLEPLEKRQLLAGDMELLFTDPGPVVDLGAEAPQTAPTGLQAAGVGEGEAAGATVVGTCRGRIGVAAPGAATGLRKALPPQQYRS